MESTNQLMLKGSDESFAFAYNDPTFSDRILLIEITRCESETSSMSSVDCVKNLKRKREEEDDEKDNNELNSSTSHQIDLNKSLIEPNNDDNNNNNNKEHEGEMVVMAEQKSQSGGEDENEFYAKMKNLSNVKVTEIHINSAILAAQSPFFYKLFSINGMLESEQKHRTLKIDASEESAVMELLKFMYTNSLPTMAAPALLDVLVAADKYQVASCVKYVSNVLLQMPMALDASLLILELPSTLLMDASVNPVANAARTFLVNHYKDISKFPTTEVMALPLPAFEAILASEEIEITAEDFMYELVIKWARHHYPNLEERQEILKVHLARYIRFHHMSSRRLKKILTSDDFTLFIASKIVLGALFMKADHLNNSIQVNQNRYGDRVYKYKPIKTVEFDSPLQQCIVYFDLRRQDCESIYPSDKIISQPIQLGGQYFFLTAHCNMDQQDMFQCFGVFLVMQEKNAFSIQNPSPDNRASENTGPTLNVEYVLSARSKPSQQFAERYKGNYAFTGSRALGYKNFFGIPWDHFMDKDSLYFINDVLHLRAELTLKS